ncbi:MAG: helix-turn-helix transcriptional regulator [Clostridiales bacterium]
MVFNPSDWTLKQLRNYRGLEQKNIADELEISPSAYSKKELGQRKFDIDEFKKLCEIFKSSMEDMYIIINNK